MSNVQSLSAEAMCLRVGCHTIAIWLTELAKQFALAPEAVMPTPILAKHEVLIAEHGVRLLLSHPHANYVELGDIERWELTDIQFGLAAQFGQNWCAALPFGLDAEHETPISANAKLGSEASGLTQAQLAKGDRRQIWFQDDARVIELRWRENLIGIEQVWVSRLGTAQHFEETKI